MKSICTQRRSFVRMVAATGLITVGTSRFAVRDAHAEVDRIYTDPENNLAVSGYDTVSYFTEGKPVKGIRQFRLNHEGAEWLFSSQENMDLFKANTEKYAPQYGGHCAFNIGKDKGQAIKADPKSFDIVNEKLYLNYDSYTQSLWYKNQADLIAKGDANWPTVLR